MVTCIYMKISENLNFSKGFCKLNKAYSACMATFFVPQSKLDHQTMH